MRSEIWMVQLCVSFKHYSYTSSKVTSSVTEYLRAWKFRAVSFIWHVEGLEYSCCFLYLTRWGPGMFVLFPLSDTLRAWNVRALSFIWHVEGPECSCCFLYLTRWGPGMFVLFPLSDTSRARNVRAVSFISHVEGPECSCCFLYLTRVVWHLPLLHIYPCGLSVGWATSAKFECTSSAVGVRHILRVFSWLLHPLWTKGHQAAAIGTFPKYRISASLTRNSPLPESII